jgi:hypothetical protein
MSGDVHKNQALPRAAVATPDYTHDPDIARSGIILGDDPKRLIVSRFHERNLCGAVISAFLFMCPVLDRELAAWL